MICSEVSRRYAKALYEISKDKGDPNNYFLFLRDIWELLQKNQEILDFLYSPLIQPHQKGQALEQAFAKSDSLPKEIGAFILLLAQKNRLKILPEVVRAFQELSDESNGVVRGHVRSASVLSPEDRLRIEKIVSEVTNKQAILNYKEDPQLIGGLIADVGSYVFDDSLSSHLSRLKEDLTTGVH